VKTDLTLEWNGDDATRLTQTSSSFEESRRTIRITRSMTEWTTVSRIWREALAHDAPSRDAFLDQACAGAPTLRRQIESLINTRPEPDEWLIDGFQRIWKGLLSPTGETDLATTTLDESAAQRTHRMLFASSPFSMLGSATLADVLSLTHLIEYAPGEYLIRQGDPAEFLLLVFSGRASARVRDTPPDRPPVGEFRAGDVVGEMSLVTDAPRTADVVAETFVRCLRLSASDFHDLVDRHPDLRVVLTEVVTERLGHARYDGLGGKDIHGYKIAQCVGRGGMGVVYEATELKTGRAVALKMMNHRLIYQVSGLSRFQREATILATLDHPSLAKLYARFSAYKTEFLVLEFCQGQTLRDVIAARGPLPETLVRGIIGQLAVALRYIHARGIIHRDLKPSNIMLTDDGAIKVLDFGIVTTERDSELWDTLKTASRPGAFVGTPRYMAPEQFSSRVLDRRVDYYALACVTFEALAGKSVITSSNAFEIVREQARFELPPREAIGAGISEEIYDVIARGLEHDPERRLLDVERLSEWAVPIDLRF
jgi:CRP-like cAMP-binding protein